MSHVDDELYAATLTATTCAVCSQPIEGGEHRTYVLDTSWGRRETWCVPCWGGMLAAAYWGTLPGLARAG